MTLAREFDHPDEIACPGGPLLVRGDRLVEGPDGVAHRTVRPVSAVCRCGHSGDLPWCDGTHKVLPEQLRP
jgi:CDGSH-type Zn-finger protein